jgi:hypothetical protein
MNGGWIKLYRKSLDSGLLKKHNAWVLFCYCLLKATHKKRKAIVGRQEITLFPGQFVFGRRVAAREAGLSERQIRTALTLLINLKILTNKTTNKYSIITIVNWDSYQGSQPGTDPQNDPKAARTRPQTKKEKVKNSISLEQISDEISSLRSRYSEQDLIDRAFQAIAFTRKSGSVADSVLFNQLQKWSRYSVEQVEAGIRVYLDKNYAGQGKAEKYLLGIIRNQQSKDGKIKPSSTPEWF